MKLLLDTHIWLWSIEENDRLSKKIAAELENSENELWLSPISTWEALLLSRKGRIQLPDASEEWFRQATGSFKEAPLTHEISIVSQNIALRHFDPADRFIAATAKVLGLTLVTADQTLLKSRDIDTLSNS